MVSPTGNAVSAYHQFGTLTTAHMVGVLKAHFKKSRVNWSAISTHLAPLQGRPRWFFGYFMPLFLMCCNIGDCNTPATWSNAVKAGVKATFEAGAYNMANQLRHGLAARGTSVPVDTRGEAMAETVRSTEPLPRVIQACIYSQMACNGKLQANSTAVRVLVNAAIMRAYGDDGVCFRDEPILAEALRRVSVESMKSPVDEDAGFAHIEGVQVNKGTKLELYTQWAILRRCVRAHSTPRTAHCTLRQALGSLVVTDLPDVVGDLIVRVTHSSPSNCLGGTTSLANAVKHSDTLLYGIENVFGPDLLLPVQFVTAMARRRKGVVAIRVQNTSGGDFAVAAKSIQPAFAYMESTGLKPGRCVNEGARKAFERWFKQAHLDEGVGTWVRAIMSAQSWSQDAIDVVNDYNHKTEDGRKWPVVLMDLSKQTAGSSDRMTPLRSTLCKGMAFDAEGVKPITNAMQLQWGGLSGATLMALED